MVNVWNENMKNALRKFYETNFFRRVLFTFIKKNVGDGPRIVARRRVYFPHKLQYVLVHTDNTDLVLLYPNKIFTYI